MKKIEETNEWNADRYNKHASFVSELALPVVALLNPKADEKILDLGCGEGTLALEIENCGAKVTCVDLSEDMVNKSNAKGLNAKVMNVTDMPFKEVFDAIFSNAMLHWVKEHELAVANIYRALKKGGRFVAEFGGEGNVHYIIEAMREVFNRHPEYGKFDDFWFFPSTEEYQNMLEKQGFEVTYIERIPRPTPIDDIANWLAVFSNGVTENLTQEEQDIFRDEVREILKSKIYSQKEGWVADYVRIRVEAFKL
jgi:2-isopropylmalate synthase